MKLFRYLLLSLVLMSALPAFAQQQRQRGRMPEKKEWLAKMKEVKHDFLARQLQLTDAQKKEFFTIYDNLQEERHAIEHDARSAEKALEEKGDAATDAEIDAVVARQFSIEERLGKVEQKYLPQFRKVLTRRQLVQLKHAERKFNRKLMEQRNCPPPHK